MLLSYMVTVQHDIMEVLLVFWAFPSPQCQIKTPLKRAFTGF